MVYFDILGVAGVPIEWNSIVTAPWSKDLMR